MTNNSSYQNKQHKEKIREAVGVFKNVEDLQEAVDELGINGFERKDISLLADHDEVLEKLGHNYRSVKELEDDPSVPRSSYVPIESIGEAEGAIIAGFIYIFATITIAIIVASGGSTAAAITSSVLAGAGGILIGVFLAKMVNKHHEDHINNQIRHGGLLLWVRTWNKKNEEKACQILKSHAAKDVHIHNLAVAV